MSQVPAGWYPDGNGQTRYWDGSAWTEHIQGVTHPAPPPPPSEYQHGNTVPFSQHAEEPSIYTLENFKNGYYEEKSYIKEAPSWMKSFGVNHYHVESSTHIRGIDEIKTDFVEGGWKRFLAKTLQGIASLAVFAVILVVAFHGIRYLAGV